MFILLLLFYEEKNDGFSGCCFCSFGMFFG